MAGTRDQAIRERAYAIWEGEGCPHNRDLDHWLHAESEFNSSKLTHLYRFRNINYLLESPYNELEKQEIYFANPQELNDPMEGLRDLFWQGDAIVWHNIFRHYLICLNTAWVLLAGCKEEIRFGWDHIPIVYYQDPTLDPAQKPALDAIFARFFEDDAVSSYISALAHRHQPVRRNELAVHFRNLHLMAITVIHEFYAGEQETTEITPAIQDKLVNGLRKARKVISLIEKVESEHPEKYGFAEALYVSHRRINYQLDIINRYNNLIDTTRENKNFVFLDFCDSYVQQIERRLIYPEWYAACFMAECSNSSVWGNYGDRHSGVCLKFKVRENNGRPTIKLKRLTGFSGEAPLYGHIDQPFHEVRYSRNQESVNFFGNLRAPIPMLRRFWYSDQAGGRSLWGEPIFTAPEEWRKVYWEKFLHSVTTKTPDWAYEREYRLVLCDGDILNFSNKESRKPRYEFGDLEGIIFGINTKREHKEQIMKIIEQKCRQNHRDDFKFYQAVYAPERGTIDHIEMPLLRFAS